MKKTSIALLVLALTAAALLLAFLSAAPSESPFDWRTVEHPDYKQYAANLRVIGCPERSVHDIVLAAIERAFAVRETPLNPKHIPRDEPWAAHAPRPWSSAQKRIRELRALQLEKRSLIRHSLGFEPPLPVLRSTGYRNYEAAEIAFDKLPPAKRDSVQSIQENYWQASDALHEEFPRRGPEFIRSYQRLNAEKEAALAKILTPSEVEEYEMRTQPTGTELARRTAGLDLTASEFAAIWTLRKQYEEATGRVEGIASAQLVSTESRAAARHTLAAHLQELLGPVRFKHYEMAADDNGQRLRNLGMRYGLSSDVLVQAWDLQNELDRMTRSDQRTPAAASYLQERDELDKRLAAVLGPTAFQTWNMRDVHVSLDP